MKCICKGRLGVGVFFPKVVGRALKSSDHSWFSIYLLKGRLICDYSVYCKGMALLRQNTSYVDGFQKNGAEL